VGNEAVGGEAHQREEGVEGHDIAGQRHAEISGHGEQKDDRVALAPFFSPKVEEAVPCRDRVQNRKKRQEGATERV